MKAERAWFGILHHICMIYTNRLKHIVSVANIKKQTLMVYKTGGHFILVIVVFTAKAISVMFVWQILAFSVLGFIHPAI